MSFIIAYTALVAARPYKCSFLVASRDNLNLGVEVAGDPVMVRRKESYHSREGVAADVPRHYGHRCPMLILHQSSLISLYEAGRCA